MTTLPGRRPTSRGCSPTWPAAAPWARSRSVSRPPARTSGHRCRAVAARPAAYGSRSTRAS
jgi:hypothetical protein